MPTSEIDDAYARLFQVEFPLVRRTVYLMIHDAEAAEDLTQEAFVQALLHWSKVSRFERPDAWVRRVAIRLAVRHLKRESKRVLVEASMESTAASESLDLDVINAIRHLPPQQRAVLVVYYYEDRPMKEIADMLGISESTSRQRLSALFGRVGAQNAAQAVWALRRELEREGHLR